MTNAFKLIVTGVVLAATLIGFGCSKSAGSSDSTASAASTVTVIPAVTSLALGGGTTITVSGGSGTYTNAVASEGMVYLIAAGLYTYTAPTSTTSTYVTITVTDSNGTVGYAYISIGGATTGTTTTTTATVASCAGTYDASIGGIGATLYLLGDTSYAVSGYLYMVNYYYPVIGTCTPGGAISITNLSLNEPYTGNVGITSSGQLYLTGSVTTSAKTYGWSALSRSAEVLVGAPLSSCEGTYNAIIGPNTGTMTLVQDNNNTVSGYLNLQSYWYVLSGTCTGAGGTVALTNLTTGSPYTGTVSATGVMSGTFTTSTATYNWSASK